ncbi:nucleotide-binding universal stress UspA family protein [Solirubrobacter pauli]|uniref:Nucleotide-binding universal stress UspA family protein n=1 Tax=Solirubrobacter pauli TaxID=166793 RepID=A0A660L3P9_9ACTN|nr:universal stress protein [Solirubrobacter pauli]RKQ86140.1 nucleotide-binding universal stress UspA family protein [Solirubrobacter pauli]
MTERHVLIAYDGSAHAGTAVRAAAGLFPEARASIATVPRDPLTRAANAFAMAAAASPVVVDQTVAQLAREAREDADETAGQGVEQARALGLVAEPVAIQPTAPAWTALLDAAHAVGADVLVCGTRGRGAIARALLGSTSTSLLHNTTLPLLLVPDDDVRLDGPVVVAYDGSDGANGAIGAVARLLARRTVVVHAWEPVHHRALGHRALDAGPIDDVPAMLLELHRALADDAAETTERGVQVARAAGLDAVGDTVEADEGTWRAVVSAARAHDAAVVATGTRGLGAARSVLLGSVSSGLVQNAVLPVLVVPGAP